MVSGWQPEPFRLFRVGMGFRGSFRDRPIGEKCMKRGQSYDRRDFVE